MHERGSFGNILMRTLPLDALLSLTMTTAWLTTVGVRDLAGAVLLVSIVCGVRIAAWIVQLRWLLRPLDRLERLGVSHDTQDVLTATLAVDELPTRFAIRYCLGWLGYFVIVVALVWFVFPELLTLGRTELLGFVLQLATAVLGPWMLAYPLVHRVIEPRRLELVSELQRRGVTRQRSASTLVHVVAGMVAGLVLAPSCWLAGQALVVQGEAARERTLLDGRHQAAWAARELALGGPTATTLAGTLELVDEAELPAELAAAHSRSPGAERLEFVDPRSERVGTAAAVGDGRWVVFAATVELGHTRLWIGVLSCAVAIFAWTLLAIRTTTSSLIAPLTSLRDRLRGVTKVAAGPASLRLAVARSDEIGELITGFNELLDELEDIAAAAEAVARGDLRVELSGDDHLRVVFRGMVDRLADMVAPVRIAAAEVAAAAVHIDATTRGQDLATREQAVGVDEVEHAMQRLAGSTSAISDAANEVLADAEHTRARADEVVERTAALSESLAQIRALLEQIHEVADRSDLLALNGSLEATRAGEAGRGFALVASEMRRLAERVSATVVNVRQTLAMVDAAHTATAAATRDSRMLAEHTTDAARRIFEVSREQTSETVRASQAVSRVAGLIDQSEAAAGQTRAAADGLREQARQLEQLLEHFDVGERGGSQRDER